MSFLNTFSDISRHQGSFRQYEQDRADEDAQRQKHFAQNKPSPEELKDSKEFGRVVVDTVDFMDSASEDKSESVETSAEMASSIASLGGFFAAATVMVTRLRTKYREFSKATEGLSDKGDELTNNFNYDYDKTGKKVEKQLSSENQKILEELMEHKVIRQRRGYKSFNKEKLLDQNTWKKLSQETKEFFKSHVTDDIVAKSKSLNRGQKMLMLVPAVISFGIGAAGQLGATIAQLKASKIARFQAREQLNDARNFVEYTDEQKAEAEKKASGMHIPKEKKSGMIRDLFSLGRDYEKYEENSHVMDNVHLEDIPEDDPEKAYGRQKVINRAIQKINNQAEDYSENMETASQVVLGSSVLGGFAFGKLAKVIMEKIDRAKQKKDAEKGIVKEIEDDTKMLGKEIEETKGLSFKKIGKNILRAMKANPTMAGGVISTLLAAPLAMKLQKEASRAGRYKAKRELEDNPENFINVEKSDLDKTQATGIVKKDGFLDALKSVPESIKAVFEYDKYKKTTLRDKKKFQEALKKVKVSDEQMKKAEALRTRLYKSFDVIDDRSEQYSEHVEAAAEIGKNSLQVAQVAAAMAPFIIFVRAPHKFIKPATGIVASVFERFGGFAKKYTKGIGANIEKKFLKKVERSYTFERIGFAEKDINRALLTKDDASFAKQLEALKEKFSTRLKSSYETDMYIEMIKKHRTPKADAIAEKILNGNITADEVLPPKGQRKFDIKEFLAELDPDSNKGEAISFAQDAENIAKWKTLLDGLTEHSAFYNADFKNMKDADIAKIIKNVETISQKIPEEELSESLVQSQLAVIKNPARAMIMQHEKINFGLADALITKDVMPIAYGVGGVFVAGMVSASYAIESYLSAKTKQAGRLGTMMAVDDLNKENEAAKANTQTKEL